MHFLAWVIVFLLFFSSVALTAEEPDYFLDQFGPSKEERTGWEEGLKLYKVFSSTPEFVGREASTQDKETRQALEDACNASFKDCQFFIRANRTTVLRALPDNPLYWQRFWKILKVNPHAFFGPKDQPDYQQLIPATYGWFYRDLAQDGRLNLEKALALQAGLNAWQKSHQTLLGHMITIAMRGIALRQINYAMAQASRDRDEQSLTKLIHAARPLPRNDMSFAKLFWVEREFAIGAWSEFASNRPWETADVEELLATAPPDQDPELLRRFLADPTSLLKADFDILAKHYVAESTKPWNQFWFEGIRTIDADAFDVNFINAISAPAYNTYIASGRHNEFTHNLFAALADIYTGRASPGLPGRPAPAYWRWEWQDGTYPQVCLVSETIHPRARQSTSEATERTCLEYYDEKAVAALVQ